MDKLQINEIIWQVVSSIPKGRVATYGQVAKLAGCPNHARYVGTTLKNLPNDSRLPWHRVINAKGEISFTLNSDAYQKQQLLLEAEGIIFKSAKISLKDYLWRL
ncbi:MGMT family protein [Psychromonas antarctica]|uniref:MGMT family protein n=1 Tax=Psychromonas antarctica TaxID=67573 RepID=UPI001EE78B21|nr:MGMT family protein [Psychromonas antarctica]MCG6201545.1 MGMT family protein [Psychromonas antarctica]